ncbi:hypothetical protein BCF44_12259 [Kutzneria buriramensis]|uniref:Uncharacterized protein n=1 Tax=Kutzneria buriramensis TaxID=1045776 RepID=A0A3E0GWU7_9PSEU|nr:hypothetical protein BCF44_12259 [Kutzneria buriramensis]
MRALDGRRLLTSGDFADLCLAGGWLLGDHPREAMEPSLSASTALNSGECLAASSVGPRSRWSVGTQLRSDTSGRVNRWTVLSAQLCGELFADSEALWPSGWRAHLSADMSPGAAIRARARAWAAACSVPRGEERTCRSSMFASGAVQLRSNFRPARTAANLSEYLPDDLPDWLPYLLPDVLPNDLSNKLPDMVSVSLPESGPAAMWKRHHDTMASWQPNRMRTVSSVRSGRCRLAGHRTLPPTDAGTPPQAKGWSKLAGGTRTVWRITALTAEPIIVVSGTQRCSLAIYQGGLCTRPLKMFTAARYIKPPSFSPTAPRAAACAGEPCDFEAGRCMSSRARLSRLRCRTLRRQV